MLGSIAEHTWKASGGDYAAYWECNCAWRSEISLLFLDAERNCEAIKYHLQFLGSRPAQYCIWEMHVCIHKECMLIMKVPYDNCYNDIPITWWNQSFRTCGFVCGTKHWNYMNWQCWRCTWLILWLYLVRIISVYGSPYVICHPSWCAGSTPWLTTARGSFLCKAYCKKWWWLAWNACKGCQSPAGDGFIIECNMVVANGSNFIMTYETFWHHGN